MMLQEYQIQYNIEAEDELEAFCRLEGLKPMYMRSIMKKEIGQGKMRKAGRAIGLIFRSWLVHRRMSSQLKPR